MSLTIRLEREKPREGTVQVEKGSVRAPDRQVVTLKVRVTNDSNTDRPRRWLTSSCPNAAHRQELSSTARREHPGDA
jgi:hypothetical protein